VVMNDDDWIVHSLYFCAPATRNSHPRPTFRLRLSVSRSIAAIYIRCSIAPIQGGWPDAYGKSLMARLRLKSDNFLDTICVDARLSTTSGVTIGSAPVPGANTRAC
jgi:hypothetical protein